MTRQQIEALGVIIRKEGLGWEDVMVTWQLPEELARDLVWGDRKKSVQSANRRLVVGAPTSKTVSITR